MVINGSAMELAETKSALVPRARTIMVLAHSVVNIFMKIALVIRHPKLVGFCDVIILHAIPLGITIDKIAVDN